MKIQNTNSDFGQSSRRKTIEHIQQQYPELTYEEIEDYDRALDDYINICLEMYWHRVKSGVFPWPSEDVSIDGDGDSTHY